MGSLLASALSFSHVDVGDAFQFINHISAVCLQESDVRQVGVVWWCRRPPLEQFLPLIYDRRLIIIRCSHMLLFSVVPKTEPKTDLPCTATSVSGMKAGRSHIFLPLEDVVSRY